MYKTLNEHNFEKYGCKVYKLSIDAGFTCPNRDGTISKNGCIFCSEKGSGEFAQNKGSVTEKLQKAKSLVEKKNKSGKYIAYFQSFTNTYAPISTLKKLYLEAIEPDYIVGLSIATRPDCLGAEVISLLSEIGKIKPVCVELGFQTSNEKTAQYIRRGYNNEVFACAVKSLKEAGIEVVAHIIIGLPFETLDDAVNTTKFCVDAGVDGVKFHLLHVIKNTDLEKEYLKGVFSTLSLEEYAEILKACISVLPSGITVHRITGDGDKKSLVSPLWSADKKKVLNYLSKILDK